ncbi:hypothetical protein C7S15_5589 [Burkholderia cepacia]|nr:hypothetical protein [Burkholderia cepacia]
MCATVWRHVIDAARHVPRHAAPCCSPARIKLIPARAHVRDGVASCD